MRKPLLQDYQESHKVSRKVSKHKQARTQFAEEFIPNRHVQTEKNTKHALSTISDKGEPRKFAGIIKNENILSQRNRKSTIEKLSMHGGRDNF